ERAFTLTAPKGSLVDPVYSADVAAALLAAARGKAKDATLDLCSGRPFTVRQLVKEVCKCFDTRLRVTVRPKIDEWPVRFYSEPNELRRELGLKRIRSLREGVHEYAAWMRAPS